jgi:predicted transcriptional regulator
MGHLSNLERGKIVGARLAGASVSKTATLLGVSRARVSKVMLAYMNNGKTTSAKWKIDTDRKRSSYNEKDCFIKSELLQHS